MHAKIWSKFTSSDSSGHIFLLQGSHISKIQERVKQQKDSRWWQTSNSCSNQAVPSCSGSSLSVAICLEVRGLTGLEAAFAWHFPLKKSCKYAISPYQRTGEGYTEGHGGTKATCPSEHVVPPLAPQNALITQHRTLASMWWVAKSYWQFWALKLLHIRNTRDQTLSVTREHTKSSWNQFNDFHGKYVSIVNMYCYLVNNIFIIMIPANWAK